MSELVFQDEGHKYFLDGAEIPSVNQILHDMGFSGNRFYTDDSAARGKAIHFATRKLDEGWTPEQIGLEGIEPYIESYRLFKQGHPGFQWFRIEEPMANELMRYAGTPDRIGLDESGEPCVLDIKSGASATWHRIQLAGYDFEKNLRRYGLYLSAKGREPKLVPYEEPTDYLVWDYAVYLWAWQKRNL